MPRQRRTFTPEFKLQMVKMGNHVQPLPVSMT